MANACSIRSTRPGAGSSDGVAGSGVGVAGLGVGVEATTESVAVGVGSVGFGAVGFGAVGFGGDADGSLVAQAVNVSAKATMQPMRRVHRALPGQPHVIFMATEYRRVCHSWKVGPRHGLIDRQPRLSVTW